MESLEQTPPHDLELESCALGAALIDPTQIPEMSQILAVEDFYKKANQIIWRTLVDLCMDLRVVDMVTLRTKLKEYDEYELVGGIDYLLTLEKSVPSAVNSMEYAYQIHNLAKKRRLRELGIATIRASESGEDPAETHAMIERSLRSVSGTESSWVDLRDVKIDKAEQGFDVGLLSLQDATGGLYIGSNAIAGLPGAGKTTLSLQIVNRMLRSNRKVSIISMDQTKEKLKGIMMQNWLGISKEQIEGKDFNDLLNKQCRFYTGKFEINSILSAIRINAARGYDCVLIDYLSLISNPRASDSESGMEESAKAIKRLAIELNLVVMLIISYTKPRAGEGISMTQARGKLEIVHSVEQLWIIEPDETNVNEVTLHLVKSRNEGRSHVKLAYRGNIRTFYDYGDEDAKADFISSIESALTPGIARIEMERKKARLAEQSEDLF